jgi:hypothetical protein
MKLSKDFFCFKHLCTNYGAEDGVECIRFEGLGDRVDCRIIYVTNL